MLTPNAARLACPAASPHARPAPPLRGPLRARPASLLAALAALAALAGVGGGAWGGGRGEVGGAAWAQGIPKASPEAPQYIAIIELKNQAGLSAEEVTYLTEVMRQAAKYLPVDSYPLITKENLFMLLPPGTRIEDCQGECAVDTGRKIGATWLITGEVVRISGSLRVMLELYHTPSNVRKGSDIVKGATIDELENPLQAATMTLLGDLDPSLLAKAERIRSGFVFKRVSVGALPELPAGAEQAAEEALKGVPAARADLKSLGFKDINVEELEAYDKALKLEGDARATPEQRLAQWQEVARFPRLAPAAQEQVAKWSNFLARRRELEAKRLQAIAQLNALKGEDRRAAEERDREKQAAWAKLSRLLGLSVIEDADKGKWVEAFLDAYGVLPELNEHARSPLLTPFLSAAPLSTRLPALEAQGRAELEARARRAEEIERRLCSLSDDKEWTGGRCAPLSERRACEGRQMRWEEGACRETAASCGGRGLVLEGASCALSPEARAAEEDKRRRQEEEAAYERARSSLRALALNVAGDGESIYELSSQSNAGFDRQNLSLDAARLLGALSVSLNMTTGDAQGFGVSTAGLSVERKTDGGGTLGFGFYYPFGGSAPADRARAFEAKRMSAFGDRWRWDAERVSLTLPMSVAAPLRRGAWDLRASLTPVVALGGEEHALPPGVDPAWAGAQETHTFELYTQTALSLSRLVGSGGSLAGLRYQAHYSLTATSGAAQGAWAPYVHIRLGDSAAIKLEGLFYSRRPTLAAFNNLDEHSLRAALWFNTDRGSQSAELCKATLYTGVGVGTIYAIYKGIMALADSSDSSDSSSNSETDGATVGLYTLGYLAVLTLPSVLIANADDICE